MLVEKRYFFEGQDGDTSPRLLGDKVALNIMNGRMSVSEYGRMGRVENIPGTILLQQSVYPPYGYHHCIGSAQDTPNNRIIYCLWNSFNDHGIYCLDYSNPTNPIIYAVLYDSQVIGGLGFSKGFRIDRNCKVMNGIFYWTDNKNEPRRVNIEAGIKTNKSAYATSVAPYSYPMNPQVVTIIRKPPNYTLTATKKNASDVGLTLNTNQIKNFSFRFCYFYTYRDGERSTLSMHSVLMPYNYADETFNVIQLKVPFVEAIDQDVQKVTLCVIYATQNEAFEIKTWDKASPADLAAINSHNSSITNLTFNFTNSDVGVAIDNATLAKPFDSVPLLSKTLERANHRLFLGNNLMGYNTPPTTSLNCTVIQQDTSSGVVNGGFYELDYMVDDSTNPGYMAEAFSYVLYFPVPVDATHPAGYYSLTSMLPYSMNQTPVPTSPVNINDYTFLGTDPNTFFVPAGGGGVSPTPLSANFTGQYFIANVSTTGTAGTSSRSILKSDSVRRVGIVFYDKYMRQCGVRQSNSGLITIPDRSYSFSNTYNYAIQWALSNSNAAFEIPDWAYYYSIVSTNDLVRSFFIQARAGDIKYATKDSSGNYLFTSTTYAETNAGIAVKLDLLQGYGMGYAFNQGDILKVWAVVGSTLAPVSLSVIAQSGDWVVGELHNFGSLTGANAMFEIYTPRNQAAGQFYYEQGNINAITNPTQSNRQYSLLQGQIAGDIYLLTRGTTPSTYITENMSPSTTIWQTWLTNAGRVQVEDKIGQKRIYNSVRWSNTYLEGTLVNGLSSFDALDQQLLPIEMGELQKLQLTSKVGDEQGVVMLGIAENETASMYIGEVQLYGSNQASTLAQSPNVLSKANVLKGSQGTINPESVIEYNGLVFFYNALKGTMVQYAANGLEEISRYKMSRLFKNYSKAYLDASPGNLDNINGFHHIATAIDPFHKELLVGLPGLIYSNYATNLPSYSSVPSFATSILNRFDIFDMLQKTMSFSFEENKWGSNYEYGAEWFDNLQNALFGFKNGYLYLHNADTVNWNRFYGVSYPTRLCFTGNMNASMIKDLANICVEGNRVPDFTVAYTDYPNIQITDLCGTDYDNLEGMQNATFFKDRLSPNATGSPEERMYSAAGDVLQDIVIKIMLEWKAYDSLLYVNAVDVGYNVSKGQKQILTVVK